MEGFKAVLRGVGGEGLFKVWKKQAFKDFSCRTEKGDWAVGGGKVRGFTRF